MTDETRRETSANPFSDMTDGHDNPNRGPLDRLDNAMDGRNDQSGGSVGTMGAGGTGAAYTGAGVSGASGTGTSGMSTSGTGTSGAGVSGQSGQHQAQVISAVFDTDDEARQAVAELRSLGVSDASLSLITQKRGTTTTSNADGDVVDEEHTNLLRGILGGGALGAGLGVAALAIPGIGPLVAAGAIAASAVPGAVAAGAAVGVVAGSVNEALKSHGISDEDASYYSGPMKSGGVLVTVHTQSASLGASQIHEVLSRNGGHSSARART